MRAPCDGGFEGLWRTNYGPLRLTVAGDRVTGSYDQGAATVEGTLRDGVLEGTWHDYSGHGRMRLVLTGATTMAGTWTREAGPGGAAGDWTGECVLEPATDAGLHRGAWESTAP